MRRSLLCVMCLILLGLTTASAQVLRNDPFNTNPDPTASTFRTNGPTFWNHEDAQREGRHWGPFVSSGGLHATAASLTTLAFATEAFVPERVNQTATAVTFAASAADVCWLILSSDTDGITGWTRVGSTAYYFKCEGDTTPNLPTLPPNSAWLSLSTITASAIATVTDLRRLTPTLLNGSDACAYDSLDAAVTAVGSTPTVLDVNCPLWVTAAPTVPLTMGLRFGKYGKLLSTVARTVTYLGSWEAPLRQVIGTAITDANVTVNFQPNSHAPGLYPVEWWGADAAGVVNSCPAIQRALDQAAAYSLVLLGPSSYLCTGTTGVQINQEMTLAGTHRRYSRLYWNGSTTGAVIHVPYTVAHVTVKDLGIRLASTGTAALGIHGEGARTTLNTVTVEPDIASNRFGTACLRSSDTLASNEHVYRHLDLPYCPIGIQATNGTSIIIDDAVITSYNVGVSVGNVPAGEVVGTLVIQNSLFSTSHSVSPFVNSTAIVINKGGHTSIINNNFEPDNTAGDNYVMSIALEDATVGMTSFTNNRVSGDGNMDDAIRPNGNSVVGLTIAHNSFTNFAAGKYVVRRFAAGGEIVTFGPNYYRSPILPVNPQFPVLNVATPDVGDGHVFKAADSAPTTWTSFVNGKHGLPFTVYFSTANSTISFSTSVPAGGANKIVGNNHVDKVMAIGDVLTCLYDAGTTYTYCAVGLH